MRIRALLLATLLSCASARAAETWDAYTYLPNIQVIAARNLQAMLDEMNAASGGAVSIRMHLGGTLSINAANITAAVSDDVVQIADYVQYIGSVPIAGVLRLPLLADSFEDYAKAYAVLFPYIEAAMRKKGVTVLASYAYPLQVLWGRKKVTALADLKGLKMRVSSPEQAEFVKRYGAIAVTLATSEVPASLDRGVVDGVITAASGAGYLWRDLLKYQVRHRHQLFGLADHREHRALPEAARRRPGGAANGGPEGRRPDPGRHAARGIRAAAKDEGRRHGGDPARPDRRGRGAEAHGRLLGRVGPLQGRHRAGGAGRGAGRARSLGSPAACVP